MLTVSTRLIQRLLLLLMVLAAGTRPLTFTQATQVQGDNERCATFLRLNYLVEPLGKYGRQHLIDFTATDETFSCWW